MMNLLIDIGNSSTKVAISENRKIIEDFRFIELNTDKILDMINEYKIQNSALSNVSTLSEKLKNILTKNTSFYSFSSEIKIPFDCSYKLSDVGDDRLALMAAAYYDFPNENVLVIDMGTCITYDIKTSNNNYKAGGISPGLNMRIKSISDGAFKLNEITPAYPESLIASDTKSSLDIGIVMGIKSEIKGFISQYSSQFTDLKVIITGGDSKILSGKIKNTIFTNSNYVFKGLDFLIEYNKRNA